jgi:hypothetical protein
MQTPSRLYTRLVAAIIAASLAAAPAFADPPHGKGRGKGKAQPDDFSPATQGSISVGISVTQARRMALDAGATGYQPLPPGIRKNLARGKPLPPRDRQEIRPRAHDLAPSGPRGT